MTELSSDMAFSIGLFAGWMALVVWLVWPNTHCKCCTKGQEEKRARPNSQQPPRPK